MIYDAEKKEKMLEFFKKNAFNPLTISPQEFKREDKSSSD
jgi:hypothetical protein